MVRKIIDKAVDWLEATMRRLCGRITPDKRVIVILTTFFLFAALSLWFTVSSIYRFGKAEGRRLQIEHIEMLELERGRKQSQPDSLKHLNENNYEYERETE